LVEGLRAQADHIAALKALVDKADRARAAEGAAARADTEVMATKLKGLETTTELIRNEQEQLQQALSAFLKRHESATAEAISASGGDAVPGGSRVVPLWWVGASAVGWLVALTLAVIQLGR
jgi:pyruvate/oxaloacetate carboxyltransferase